MKRIYVVGVLSLFACSGGELAPEGVGQSRQAVSTQCDQGVLDDVLAPGTGSVRVNCSLTIPPTDASGHRTVVTKEITFEGAGASDATLECPPSASGTPAQIASVNIRSAAPAPGSTAWSRPENVTLRRCHIRGDIRVSGMGSNGEAAPVVASSREAGHTARVQANAPTNIRFENLIIQGIGPIPLYLSPGVTHVTLIGSEVTGISSSVGIYLDTESAHNVIQNNYIHVTTIGPKPREEMAVDGSAFNTIVGNRFSALDNGGIFLYRNCGEKGGVRHQPPSYNHIINNWFFYDEYDGDKAAVQVGAREGDRDYCNDDAGFPFGSSLYDGDLAHHNVIAQNRVVKLDQASMLRQSLESTLSNVFLANETAAGPFAARPSACYVPDSHPAGLLAAGSTLSFLNIDGQIRCLAEPVTCSDGILMAGGKPVDPYALQSGSGWDFGVLKPTGIAVFQSDVLALEQISRQRYPSGFNAFVFGDLELVPDAEGAIAAGGNVTLTNVSVNHGKAPVGLVAGGSLSVQTGTLNGYVLHGGAATLPPQVHVVGMRRQVAPIDFEAARSKLTDFSNAVAQTNYEAAQLGTTTVQPWGALVFQGQHPTLNVFTVKAADLSATHSIQFEVPAGAHVIVNVTFPPGSSSPHLLDIQNVGFSLGQATPSRMLWNLPTADVLTLRSLAFPGSLLAPLARINFDSGNIDGTLVAASLHGTVELHSVPLLPWPGIPGSCSASTETTRLDFECRIEGNNNGCDKTVACPDGTFVARARAACNLEFGAVTTPQLEGVSWNQMSVVRPSDTVTDGACRVGSQTIFNGSIGIGPLVQGRAQVDVGCDEHDENGGDCHIRGQLECSPTPASPNLFEFECRTLNSNAGCSKRISCPAGMVVSSVKAACNLEFGDVSDAQLANTSDGVVRVVSVSDVPDDGRCQVASTAVSTGQASIQGTQGADAITLSCHEHDENGGDCHVRALVTCAAP